MEPKDLSEDQMADISGYYQEQHAGIIKALALNVAIMSKQPDGALRLMWLGQAFKAMICAALDTMPDEIDLENMPVAGCA